ncbi:MAG: transposase [Crocinitomicaceae bacterium]|nr:transposase [Crocinitomicaceae bacterium]
MRKVNTIGIKQANKVMLMAGTAYNLKKYLKFVTKTAKSKAEEVKASLILFFELLSAKKMRFEPLIY